MIEIVAGVIVRDGRLLVGQRPPSSSCPWALCSPGGKIEPGESAHDALRREIREELGVGSTVDEYIVAQCRIGPPVLPRDIRATFFPVALDEPPIPVEFVGLCWLRPIDLTALQAAGALTPADAACMGQIIAYMRYHYCGLGG